MKLAKNMRGIEVKLNDLGEEDNAHNESCRAE